MTADRSRLRTHLTRLRRERWTVRARLTLLYAGLLLLSGIVLLAITYVLFNQATANEAVTVVLPDGTSVAANVDPDGAEHPDGDTRSSGSADGAPATLPDPQRLREIATEQHDARMRNLLVQSGTALVIMAVVSIILGWVIAGRALRPLRVITDTTRRITAQNLHERLALSGPADELKALGDTIDDLLARLEHAFQAQRRFIANASHELRTPLARQRAIMQVALDDPEASIDLLRAAHERALVAGADQERLIEGLLALAEGQAGATYSEPLDLATVATHVLASRRDDIENAQLTVGAHLAPAAIRGDERLIERLVVNLIDNAIRYNHAGGAIDIWTRVESEKTTLTAVNSGPILPPEAVSQLTEPFRRFDGDRIHRGDGHGLGLSIVAAIAEAHHASLFLRHEERGGLRVIVEFDTPPEAQAQERTAAAGHPAGR
ncbi:MAG TPA: HAMP domain-containing sensor histidine kinase [Microbacterium sp.]|nr:HAMP domain-containing sensor histidine kinase [Microbacterium sp.]